MENISAARATLFVNWIVLITKNCSWTIGCQFSPWKYRFEVPWHQDKVSKHYYQAIRWVLCIIPWAHFLQMTSHCNYKNILGKIVSFRQYMDGMHLTNINCNRCRLDLAKLMLIFVLLLPLNYKFCSGGGGPGEIWQMEML